MTDHPSEMTDRDIASEAQLTQALDRILVSAVEHGVDIQGSYEFRNGPDHPDIEVEIVELAKQRTED